MGQGASLAIEDALELARQLAEPHTSVRSVPPPPSQLGARFTAAAAAAVQPSTTRLNQLTAILFAQLWYYCTVFHQPPPLASLLSPLFPLQGCPGGL